MSLLSALATALASMALGDASNADSALNLLDAPDFFVCGSRVVGMDGHYVLSDELQSDEHTPVFVREDEDKGLTAVTAHDFRLYRHNGFWLFADVAAWPPTTHFRCDPTKRDVDGINTLEACGMNLQTPPRVGYSPVDPKSRPLELHANDCAAPLATPKAEL